MARFNNACYHCGTPLVYGQWQVNVFRAEEFAPTKAGAEMFLCPKCEIGWEVLRTSGDRPYPSFMADGHEWRADTSVKGYVARHIAVTGGPFWMKASVRYGDCTFNTEGGDPPKMIDELVAQIERRNKAVDSFRSRSAVQSSKDTPMNSRWVPVHRLAEGHSAVPYWADTASEAIFSIRLTCVCGQNHHFEGRGGSLVWVCEDCGRVYRAKATFAVEQHMGDGR